MREFDPKFENLEQMYNDLKQDHMTLTDKYIALRRRHEKLVILVESCSTMQKLEKLEKLDA